jgi:arsenate reductase
MTRKSLPREFANRTHGASGTQVAPRAIDGSQPRGEHMDTYREKILFISTGNSVRSIFAEYLMNSEKIGFARFEAFSAGSFPTGRVHPYTIRVLDELYKIDARRARSKSWDEFRRISFDMVITVCDKAKESCPLFPGQPKIANWNIVSPEEKLESPAKTILKFKEVAQQIQTRLQLLCSFPLEKLTHLRLDRSARTTVGLQP